MEKWASWIKPAICLWEYGQFPGWLDQVVGVELHKVGVPFSTTGPTTAGLTSEVTSNIG